MKLRITKDKLRTYTSILSFAVMLTTVSYLLANDVVLKTESRRVVEICREEAKNGCPLTLESLEEINETNIKISRRNEELRRQINVYRELAIQLEQQCVLQSTTDTQTEQ